MISVRHNHFYLFVAWWLKILCRDFCSMPTVLEHTVTILLSNFLLCRLSLPYQHMRLDVTRVSSNGSGGCGDESCSECNLWYSLPWSAAFPSATPLSNIGGLQLGFQGVAFQPSRASFFPPPFLKIVVEVKASGPRHVIQLWLGVSKDMLPVRYFRSNNSSFCVSRIPWRP